MFLINFRKNLVSGQSSLQILRLYIGTKKLKLVLIALVHRDNAVFFLQTHNHR